MFNFLLSLVLICVHKDHETNKINQKLYKSSLDQSFSIII